MVQAGLGANQVAHGFLRRVRGSARWRRPLRDLMLTQKLMIAKRNGKLHRIISFEGMTLGQISRSSEVTC